MNILITGGCGHIGSYLISKMARGHNLTVVDNMSTQRYASLLMLEEPVNFIEDSFQNIECEILKQQDIVIHLAAVTDAVRGDSQAIEQTNVKDTKEFIAKINNFTNPPLFIFPSSTSVYGTAAEIVREDDVSVLKPQSYYARAKLIVEHALEKTSRSYLILRFGTIFGVSPGMRFHTAVNQFCWQAALGQPLNVWKNNYSFKRPYLGIDDAIRSIEHLIANKEHWNQTYNVLSTNSTCENIVNTIINQLPDIQVNMVDTPLLNQFSYIVSDTKIQNTGFEPNDILRDGIRNTLSVLGSLNQ